MHNTLQDALTQGHHWRSIKKGQIRWQQRLSTNLR